MLKTKSGFTLVELLIVIVVIAILAVITIVAYNGVQAKARDSSRTSAVKSIQKALEAYRTEYGSYPSRIPITTAANAPAGFNGAFGMTSYSYSVDTAGNWLKNLTISPDGSQPIISKVPVDPVNDNDHYFVYWVSSSNGYGTVCTNEFYILGVQGYEDASDIPSDSHGVNCTSSTGPANWTTSSSRAIFSNIKGQ